MSDYRPHMLPKVRSERIMESMSGLPCTLRIASFVPGRRCYGPSTTVGCHLPVVGKGAGTKVTDMAVAAGCMACHDILDGRDAEAQAFIAEHYPAAMMQRMLNALVETHAILIDMGVIHIPNARIG